MTTFIKRLPALVLAAGLAATPAFATVTHFDLGFDKPLNKSATSVSFATTVDGITLNVKVTAVQLSRRPVPPGAGTADRLLWRP